MYFTTAVVAAFAATYVSASPIAARGNTCGAAPAGSNNNNQPIAQPSAIQTSDACQTQCEANASCKSFCFGLVDSAIQCKLFSVDASAVPRQSSPNLVVYDKACSSVPNVIPSASNPTGMKQDNNQNQNGNGSGSKETQSGKTGGQQTTDQKQTEQKQTEQKQFAQKQAQTSNEKNSGTQKQFTEKNASAGTCGNKPSANTNQQPFSSPSVDSEAACKTKCQGDGSCKSFTCGKVDNAFVCKLYSVTADQVPAPSDAAQKNALKSYDVGCSL